MSENRNGGSEGNNRGNRLGVALDPSIASAWRKHIKERSELRGRPIKLDLPSGLPITAVRMPVRYLLSEGIIPDPLTPIIKEHIALLDDPAVHSEGESAIVAAFDADPEASWHKWIKVVDTIWLACVVQPSFTDDEAQVGAEGAEPYSVHEADYFDKLYVYQWTQGVDQPVAEFLQQQSEIMGIVADEPIVQDAAKRVLRIDRRGGRVAGPVGGSSDLDVGIDGGTVAAGDEAGTATQSPEERAGGSTEVQPGSNRADDLRPAAKRARRRAAATSELVTAS